MAGHASQCSLSPQLGVMWLQLTLWRCASSEASSPFLYIVYMAIPREASLGISQENRCYNIYIDTCWVPESRSCMDTSLLKLKLKSPPHFFMLLLANQI